MSDKKPILEQIKDAINNREQIRENLNQNLQLTKQIVEAQAKDLFQKSKKTDFFKTQVVPLAESELADKAFDVLNTHLKLKGTPVMNQIEKLRKDIIDSKVGDAREVPEKEELSKTEPSEN